jgi:uncharacterized membrane protein YsdA (DUF1294 family)
MQTVALIVLAVYAVMSVITLAAYGIDKRQAKLGRRRIRERTLHTLEFCCGWPGALVGRTAFKHKRQKVGFSVITLLLIPLNLAMVVGIVVLLRR